MIKEDMNLDFGIKRCDRRAKQSELVCMLWKNKFRSRRDGIHRPDGKGKKKKRIVKEIKHT